MSVTYRYNQNAIVEVEAMDLESGQVLPFRVASDRVTLADIAQGRTPHQVILVVDSSGSMYGARMEEARQTAARITRRMLSKPHRKVAVVACPGGVRQLPTQDERKLTAAIEGLIPIGSSPLSKVLERADEAVQPEAGVGRVFVVITDGLADEPEPLVDVAARLRTSGAHLIAVGVGVQPNAGLLKRTAGSDDDYFTSDEEFDLGGSFANLATWTPNGSGG